MIPSFNREIDKVTVRSEVQKSVSVFPVTFAMTAFKVRNLLLLLIFEISSLESRPTPILGELLNLFGMPPMYPTQPGMYPTQPPQAYGPQFPQMFNLQQPVPLYRNQPMPALFAQSPQQPYQQPNPYQQPYPWPRYTMTPPGGHLFNPGISPLGAGLFNFADAQGYAFQNIVGGIFGSIASIFDGVFRGGMGGGYPPPWMPL